MEDFTGSFSFVRFNYDADRRTVSEAVFRGRFPAVFWAAVLRGLTAAFTGVAGYHLHLCPKSRTRGHTALHAGEPAPLAAGPPPSCSGFAALGGALLSLADQTFEG